MNQRRTQHRTAAVAVAMAALALSFATTANSLASQVADPTVNEVSPMLTDDAVTLARSIPTYAGVFYDLKRGGELTFLFTDGGEAYRQEIAALLPPETEFATAFASLTYPQLLSLRDQIFDARDHLSSLGIELTGVSLDPRANKVQVGIKDLTDSQATTLYGLFGTAIGPENEDYARNDSCTSIINCWPMKSGLEIASDNQSALCTAGYLAARSNEFNQPVYVITAGHCLYQSNALEWWAGLSSGHNVDQLGIEGETTFTGVSGGTIAADVGFLHYDDWQAAGAAPYNKITYNNSNPPSLGSLVAFKLHANEVQGTALCRMGYGSGYLRSGYTAKTCKDPGESANGVIIDVDAVKTSCATPPTGGADVCMNVNNETIVDFDSTGGDSGGPYYLNPSLSSFDPNSMWLWGIHTHSIKDSTCDGDRLKCKGWFSSVDIARQALIDKFGSISEFNMCENTYCTVP